MKASKVKKFKPIILSGGGKIVLSFPWYSYQRKDKNVM